MGVDYDAKLIIGFELDSEKVKDWMSKYDIEDEDELNSKLKEKFPEIPEKIYKNNAIKSSTASIYIVRYGNNYSDQIEYFLTFYESGIKIKDIEQITPELFEIAKKVYRDIEGTDLVECSSIKDIPIFATLYVW